jgi:hypothetical protein
MEGKMIKWINMNPNAQPDERGYWESYEGRFEISPQYRHTIYPDSYTIRDSMKHSERNFDTVRACKQWAEHVIEDERKKQ